MGLSDDFLTEENWERDPWSLYIFGEYGCGKTVLAASARDSLLFDIEKSRRTLRKEIHSELLKATRIIPISSGDRVAKLRSYLPKLQNKNDPDAAAIKTVVLDTSTTLQKRDLQVVMKKAVEKNSNRSLDVPSEAEYTENNRRVSRLLQDYVETSTKNVIILCHVKEEKELQNNEQVTVLTRPGNSDGLYRNICEMVDGVFYMRADVNSKGEVTRTLRTMATRKIIGKNRFDFPAELINPTMTELELVLNK